MARESVVLFFFHPHNWKKKKLPLICTTGSFRLIFVCVYRLVFFFFPLFFGLVSLTKEQRVTGWEPPPPPGVPYFSVVVFFLISTNRSAQLLAVSRISNDAIDPGMVVHGISFLIFQSAVYNTKLEVKKKKKEKVILSPILYVYVLLSRVTDFFFAPCTFFLLGR